jgi:hypothetical protein
MVTVRVITNKATSNEARVEDLVDEVSITEQLLARGKGFYN